MTVTASSLASLFESYRISLPNQKFPRAFVRTLSHPTAKHLAASWVASDEYASFEDLEESATPDVVASHARERETGLLAHLTHAPDAHSIEDAISKATSQLNHDRMWLAKHASDIISEELMTMAFQTINASFDEAKARLSARAERARAAEDANIIIEPRVRLTNDLDDAQLPTPDTILLEWDQDDNDDESIVERLLTEATNHLQHIYLALMPSLDKGHRLLALRQLPLALAGPRTTVRRAIDDYEDAISRHNPQVVADGYELIPDQMIVTAIRATVLKNTSDGAKDLFNDFVGRPTGEKTVTAAHTLTRLAHLPVDYDRQVVLPWRAFCNQRDSNPHPPVEDGQSPRSNVRSNVSIPRDSKPRPHRIRGNDPYVQFKDRSKFDIPANWTNFCTTHGFNSTHVTKDCKGAKPADTKPEPSLASDPITTDDKSDDSKPADKKKPNEPRRSSRLAKKLDEVEPAVSNATPTLHTPVTINDITLDATIDTGAYLSCISAGTCERLLAGGPVTLSMTNDPPRFADQSVSTERRRAHVTLHLPSISEYPLEVEWVMQVIPGDHDKLLVGADLLRHIGLMTDKGISISMPSVKDDDQAVNLPPHRYIDAVEPTPADPIDAVHIDPNFPEQEKLKDCLRKHAGVFSSELHPDGADLPPATITLKPDAKLPQAKPRPVRPDWVDEIKQQLADLEEKGIIEDSTSHVASPVVIVDRKVVPRKALRLCCDYRELNEATVPDQFPMEDTRTILNPLLGCKTFFTLDLVRGYHQMPMHPDHVPLTAFVMPGVFKQYKYAPFGLRNLPAQFQRAVAKVIHPLHKDGVRNYIDDIFGGAGEPIQLIDRVDAVLTRVEDHRMRLAPGKCYFGYTSIEILGELVQFNTRKPAPQRIVAIKTLPRPSNKHEVRQIVGQLNFLQDYIKDSQTTLRPIYDILTDDNQFNWGGKQAHAWRTVISQLTSDTALTIPDLSKPWILQTDASTHGVGGVLWQVEEDDSRTIVSYFSKAFSDVQTRWSTFDQELFGIVYCLTRSDLAALFLGHPNLTICRSSQLGLPSFKGSNQQEAETMGHHPERVFVHDPTRRRRGQPNSRFPQPVSLHCLQGATHRRGRGRRQPSLHWGRPSDCYSRRDARAARSLELRPCLHRRRREHTLP